MKRTLLEGICGLAAFGLLASLHWQVACLEDQQRDVAELEHKVERVAEATATIATRDPRDELAALRELASAHEARVRQLEAQLESAQADALKASAVAAELARTRSDAAAIRTELSSDFERTRQMVDAYVAELRAKGQDAAVRLSETQASVQRLEARLQPDAAERTRRMLLPTVQLNGDDTVGSGTLVFSGPNPRKDGKVENYVLTSYHVVRNILADTPKAQADGFDVTIYLPGEKVVVKGRMVAHQPKIDAALVQLDSQRALPFVATVLPRAQAGGVKVWEPVCAVGCPLGNDPVPSHGEVSSLHNELNGANYWMINAPAYFGNSGGGVYRADTRELIGVFSKIYTHGRNAPVVVPHMGLCTPIAAVYEWLAAEECEHLLAGAPAPTATPAK
jgi:S1-C subfamily serine protease